MTDTTEASEAPSGASRRVRGSLPPVVSAGERPLLPTPEERIVPPVEGRVRLRLVVAYHGAAFHGVAPQPGLLTVGGVLLDAIAKVLREPGGPEALHLVMSGRTDAGVHAWGQVVHVDVLRPTRPLAREPRDPSLVVEGIDLDRVHRSLNSLVGPHVVVRTVDIAPGSFDARFSAAWRRYRYSILTTATPDPFLHGLVWHVNEPLDLSVMRLAADAFLGDHDFASFCRAPEDGTHGTTIRRVTEVAWHDTGTGVLEFEIQAWAFCQQMVRSIVGFLVDVGRGRRSAGSVLETLAARSRGAAATLAPSDGLCLREVGYPPGVGPLLPD